MYNVGGGEGGVGLCWRPYTAEFLHSVWDQIQCLQNCLTTSRQKLGGGGGLRKINSRRKVLFQVIFKTKRFGFCIAFHESIPSTATSFPSLVSFLLSVRQVAAFAIFGCRGGVEPNPATNKKVCPSSLG